MAATTRKKAAAPGRNGAADPVTTAAGESTPASGVEADAQPKAAAKAKKAAAPKAKAAPASKTAAAPKVSAKPKAASRARASSKAVVVAEEPVSPGIADTLVAEIVAEPVTAAVEPAVTPSTKAARPRAAAKKKTAAPDAGHVMESATAVASPHFPDTEYSVVEKLLVGFLASEVRKVGLSRAVLGLSGGVDSAVSAAIAARALGPSNVLGIFMPYHSSSPESRADADAVAAALGIELMVVDISSQVDAYFERFADASRLRRGNKMARERMTILYDHSAARSALVVGTSNKTELLLGYGTLYGDMASALNPIGDLYKTQVWGLARHLGLPPSVIEKAPTADLWSGQTDENELGFSYHEVDRLLYRMIDERCSASELEDMGFDATFVERISRMVRSSQFKRRLPVIAKLSARSIDTDFRYSRDWGL
jgi:NAD+ synthase